MPSRYDDTIMEATVTGSPALTISIPLDSALEREADVIFGQRRLRALG